MTRTDRDTLLERVITSYARWLATPTTDPQEPTYRAEYRAAKAALRSFDATNDPYNASAPNLAPNPNNARLHDAP